MEAVPDVVSEGEKRASPAEGCFQGSYLLLHFRGLQFFTGSSLLHSLTKIETTAC